jgi:transposase
MKKNKRDPKNKKADDKPNKYDEYRLERAKKILQQKNPIKRVANDFYLVKSDTGRGWYQVMWCGDGWYCECPDFKKNHRPCKHVWALKLHFDGYVSIEGEKIEETKKTYPRNWSEYNNAQTKEGEYFEKILRDLLSIVKEPKRRRGKPPLKLSDRLFCCIMKIYNQTSSRRSQSLIKQAFKDKKISRNVRHNCISKTLLNPEITSILQELVLRSASPLKDIETGFAIDSSGFRCSSFGAYNGDRHAQKRMHKWLKVHISTGVKTNIVAGVVITSEHKGDSPQVRELLRQIAQNFRPKEVYADSAYCTQISHDLVAKYGGTAFILFRKNITGKTLTSQAMKKSLDLYKNHPNEFLEKYHLRSNAEATFAAIKQLLGETIKSKKFISQKNEMLCKIIAYNIIVLIHAMFELGINLNFLDENI